MREKAKRILITGASGFIGSALFKKLSEGGYDVWGIARQRSVEDRILLADLLSYESTCLAFSKMPDCQILIHAAALAHSEKKNKGNSYFRINSIITQNVVRVVKDMAIQPHFIFLSSIAVYGEDGHNDPIKITEKLRPSTEYGISKVYCEEIVRRSGFQKYHILRLAPVFDQYHAKDIRKRVYFPGQSKFKMRVTPSPQYSFCHIETLKKTIFELLQNEDQNSSVINVTDQETYDQNWLIKQFPGVEMPCPTIVLMPWYYLSLLLFPKIGYASRCLFWKLFKNNLYE
jgi:nucleoside-diphosphate-sugar epimerase